VQASEFSTPKSDELLAPKSLTQEFFASKSLTQKIFAPKGQPFTQPRATPWGAGG
jgi:hypothetical protein